MTLSVLYEANQAINPKLLKDRGSDHSRSKEDIKDDHRVQYLLKREGFNIFIYRKKL